MQQHENPFCVPGRTLDQPGPLTPWKEDKHTNYYAGVDHTEESYQEFANKLRTWNIVSNGAAVLVHGEDGCGKTSLIHRCASTVKDSLKQERRIEIVDRSLERLDGQTVTSKCEDVVRAVLRHLRRTSGFLSANELESVSALPSKAEESDLRRTMEEIAEAINASNGILVVIPSKLELSIELQMYMSVFTRGSLVLLMETNQENIRQFVERWNVEPTNRNILNLGVGPLEVEQGWTFVESRIKGASQKTSLPEFDKTAVTKYMQTRSQHARVSIRELERVCLKVFEDAIKQSKQRIEYTDFADLWVRHGGMIR